MQKRTSQLTAKENEVRKSPTHGRQRVPCWGASRWCKCSSSLTQSSWKQPELGISRKDCLCWIFVLIPASPKPQRSICVQGQGSSSPGLQQQSPLHADPRLLPQMGESPQSPGEKPKPLFRSWSPEHRERKEEKKRLANNRRDPLTKATPLQPGGKNPESFPTSYTLFPV